MVAKTNLDKFAFDLCFEILDAKLTGLNESQKQLN